MKLQDLADIKVQLLVVTILLILYLVTKHIIFGILMFVVILYGTYLDLKNSSKKKGYWDTMKDLAINIGLVILVSQLVGIAIGTNPSPEPILIFPSNTFRPVLSVIPSCSMEPNYRQGDLLLIGGASDIHTLDLRGKFNDRPVLLYKDKLINLSTSIWVYCGSNQDRELCKVFREDPSSFVEIYGDLKIYYGICERLGGRKEVCVKAFGVSDNVYNVSIDNGDAVIYAPNYGDVFYKFGFIIHRVQFRLCNNECLYFTKGDNNNIFDFQFGNKPFNASRIVGKPLISIPYLGYIRIFLGGMPVDTYECKHYLIS